MKIHLMAFKTLLTTVDCQEEGSVHAVVDKWGLTVQHSRGINRPVDGVNIQPACWVLVNRISEKEIPKQRQEISTAGTCSHTRCQIILNTNPKTT